MSDGDQSTDSEQEPHSEGGPVSDDEQSTSRAEHESDLEGELVANSDSEEYDEALVNE
jgi:hypothetical protein